MFKDECSSQSTFNSFGSGLFLKLLCMVGKVRWDRCNTGSPTTIQELTNDQGIIRSNTSLGLST